MGIVVVKGRRLEGGRGGEVKVSEQGCEVSVVRM
jgi:hypothetical protein